MNNEDLAVLEHNRVVRHAYDQAYGVVEHDEQADHETAMRQKQAQAREQAELGENAALGGMVVALKMRSQNQALADMQRKYAESCAVMSASLTAVNSLVAALAKERNVPPDDLARKVDGVMTAVYDSRIEEYMSDGALDSDPREAPDFKQKREWHQP